MERTHTEHAHAKVNLLLRVLAREASGYHGLETLFQRLALHDVVTVHTGVPDRVLSCDGPAMPAGGLGAPEQNLAWRAAESYVRATGWDTGWRITIDKHIPVGGGLGGGSADAAAVLRAMDAMNPAPIGMARLLELGGLLGADVPFLVSGASRAWAWGRGDRLLVLPALAPADLVLFTFTDGVNTAAAYRALAEQRMAAGHGVTAHAYGTDALNDWERIAAIAINDFESVVPMMHAGVRALLPVLRDAVAHRAADAPRDGAPIIGMMSGSGATCFALLAGDETSGAVGIPSRMAAIAGTLPGLTLVATRTM